MTRSIPLTRARRATSALALAAIALAVPLAGCGSKSSKDNVDPASAVPATAPLYAEAIVRPEGALKENTDAAARTLTGTREPFRSVVHSLEASGALGHYSYSRDIEPWLGERIGVFLTKLPTSEGAASPAPSLSGGLSLESLVAASGLAHLSSNGAQGAVVLDVADVGKARESLTAVAGRTGGRTVAYGGTTYQVSGEGTAQAVVGNLAVIGSESAVRAAIDVHRGAAAALTASAPYAKLLAAGEPEAIGSLYIEGTALGHASEALPALSALRQLLQGATQARIVLIPAKHSVAVDADTLSASPAAAAAQAAEASHALASVPEASWLGLGVGAVGPRLQGDLALLRTLLSVGGASALSQMGGAGLSALVNHLAAHAGGLGRAFASWAGPGALFASGNGLFNLQGAAVIRSNNPARSRAAVAEVARALRQAGAVVTPTHIPGTETAVSVRVTGFPLVLNIASGHGDFVAGLGSASIVSALNPSGGFSSSPSYRSAQAALGSGFQPALVLQFPTIVSLIEGLGLSEDPGFSQVVRDLRPLGVLSGGERQLGGGISRFRLVLGLATQAHEEGHGESG